MLGNMLPYSPGFSSMFAFRRSATALALSTFLASGAPALALDADNFAARLKSVLADTQGIEIVWSQITPSGEDIVLDGVSLGARGEDDTIELGQLTFQDVSEVDGGYRVGLVALPRYALEEDDFQIELRDMTLSGLIIPGEEPSGPFGEMMLYEHAELDGASVRIADKELLRLEGLDVHVTLPEEDEGLTFTGGARRFSVDLTAADMVDAAATADALGLARFSGTLELAGSWKAQDGLASLERYDLTIEDAGLLAVSATISGYTPEFLKSLQEIQAKLADASQEERSTHGLAMLGLMQQLNFHDAQIRFSDDSLTGRVLDYFAERQGTNAAELAKQVKLLLPMALAQLNEPDFTQATTEAVSRFLDNPQNITIRLQPAEPVPFAAVAAGAVASPASLIDQLAVTVSANE